jgi:hypothetical protein
MKTLLVIGLLFVQLISRSLKSGLWIAMPAARPKILLTCKAAHDGATAGDTLYLVGSPVNYIIN